jgi:hypothetical protein
LEIAFGSSDSPALSNSAFGRVRLVSTVNTLHLSKRARQDRNLLHTGSSRQSGAETINEPVLWSLAAFENHARGKSASALEIDRIVHQHKRLQRRAGAGPLRGTDLTAWSIERGERRVMHRPFPINIHSAPIKVRAMTLLIFRIGHVPQTGWLVGFYTFPANLAIQQTADREGVVTNELGFEAQTRAAREQAIIRIAFQQSRRDRRALTISSGGNNQPHQRFQIPGP